MDNEEISVIAWYWHDLRTNLNAVAADLQAEVMRAGGLTRGRADALAKIETARAILQQTPEFWNAAEGLIVDIAAAEARKQK